MRRRHPVTASPAGDSRGVGSAGTSRAPTSRLQADHRFRGDCAPIWNSGVTGGWDGANGPGRITVQTETSADSAVLTSSTRKIEGGAVGRCNESIR